MPKVAVKRPQADRVRMNAAAFSEKQKRIHAKYGYWQIESLSYVDFPKPVTKYEDWPECDCAAE